MDIGSIISVIIKILGIALVADVVFGMLRAIKEGKFNSCFGIDGAIRKVAMMGCIIVLLFIDSLLNLNLIGIIPQDVLNFLPKDLQTVGIADIFAIVFLLCEAVSITKNLLLCNVPLPKGLVTKLTKLLDMYTDEITILQEEEKEENQ